MRRRAGVHRKTAPQRPARHIASHGMAAPPGGWWSGLVSPWCLPSSILRDRLIFRAQARGPPGPARLADRVGLGNWSFLSTLAPAPPRARGRQGTLDGACATAPAQGDKGTAGVAWRGGQVSGRGHNTPGCKPASRAPPWRHSASVTPSTPWPRPYQGYTKDAHHPPQRGLPRGLNPQGHCAHSAEGLNFHGVARTARLTVHAPHGSSVAPARGCARAAAAVLAAVCATRWSWHLHNPKGQQRTEPQSRTGGGDKDSTGLGSGTLEDS